MLGFPNAGKSSLIRRVSNAKPRVADYPFTTLAPVLGTAEAPDGRQLVLADVPGLLEGASEGVGLGDEFLAHLERARLLIHVIDAHEDDPEARFRAIDRELSVYGAGLAERPQIVVLNKVDVAPAASIRLDDRRVVAVIRTSAVTGFGIDELKRALFDLIPEAALSGIDDDSELADFLVLPTETASAAAFRVLRGDRGYLVTGRDLEAVPDEEIEAALRAAVCALGRRRRDRRARTRAPVTTGLFGGAFDPPHNGHLALAQAAISHFDLDRLIVVVTGAPPHKAVETDPETRYSLAAAAFDGQPRVELSRYEMDRAGPSYTVETVRWAAGRWRDVVFLVGADEFTDFLAWRDPEGVLRSARLGVATRPGYDRGRLKSVLGRLEHPDRVEVFEIPAFPVSSTAIRARVARGDPIDALVPEAVSELIAALGLYHDARDS